VSTGGKFVYDDEQETPNTQIAEYDYGKQRLVFEVRGLPTNAEEGVMVGDIFFGTEGYMAVDQSGWRVYKSDVTKPMTPGTLVAEEKQDPVAALDTAPHFANLLEAVRRRDAGVLNAPIEEGVASANLCHLANASYRTGRALTVGTAWDVKGDAEAAKLLAPAHRAPYTLPAF
jgi:hypothetical protein